MSRPGRALVRDLSFLAGAFLLAQLPLAAGRTLVGFALALFFPGYSLLRCLRTPARRKSIPLFVRSGREATEPASLSRAELISDGSGCRCIGLLGAASTEKLLVDDKSLGKVNFCQARVIPA